MLIASVEVHLTTASLRHGKVNGVAESLQQFDDSLARTWKEGVIEAGNKKRNTHGRLWVIINGK